MYAFISLESMLGGVEDELRAPGEHYLHHYVPRDR